MRLTNTLKDAIVSAVLGATPEIYSSDQRDKDALAVCVAKLPPAIRKVWDDKSLRGWVRLEYCAGFCYLPTGGTNHAELAAIKQRYEASEKSRRELRSHVKGVIYQFSTDEQLRKALPDLAAFIPQHTERVKQLPVATGLIDDLKAAGFPKKVRK